jgi:hypothetical protein
MKSINPYSFIPLPAAKPERKLPIPHDRFMGYSGEFAITLTSLSPFIICSGSVQGVPIQGKRDGKNRYFIPGTSLKGMLRNVYEIIEGGCLRLTQNTNLRSREEREFEGCARKDSLCPACRVFGMLYQSDVYRGKINPGDLIGPLAESIRGDAKLDITVGRPKAEHSAFYRKDNNLRGRKGYYHHEKPVQGTLQTKSVYPLPVGMLFQGTVSFKNMTLREVALLYYSLLLEEGIAHKIGFGKAAGLGSVTIQVDSMRLADLGTRQSLQVDWLTQLPTEGKIILENLKKRTDSTYQEFKKIYSIQNMQEKNYSYPSYDWFRANSQKSLEEFNA